MREMQQDEFSPGAEVGSHPDCDEVAAMSAATVAAIKAVRYINSAVLTPRNMNCCAPTSITASSPTSFV
jgi:hypothetical protein